MRLSIQTPSLVTQSRDNYEGFTCLRPYLYSLNLYMSLHNYFFGHMYIITRFFLFFYFAFLLFPFLFLLLSLVQFDLSLNIHLLSGTPLYLLIPTNWSTSSRGSRSSVSISSFLTPSQLCVWFILLKIALYSVRGGIASVHCSLLNFTLLINSVLSQLFFAELCLRTSESLVRSMFSHQVKFIIRLDTFQLLILFVGR